MKTNNYARKLIIGHCYYFDDLLDDCGIYKGKKNNTLLFDPVENNCYPTNDKGYVVFISPQGFTERLNEASPLHSK